MKILAMALMLLSIAVTAHAWDPAHVNASGPVNLPEVRETFYCQNASTSWNANNASLGFGSEIADDIPAAYAGQSVTEVTLYVAEWGGNWTNPANMIVNFYNTSCPPGYNADNSFTVPWGQCTAQMVYNGSWYVYQVLIPIGGVTLGSTTSVGGVVGNGWGQNAPYCGLVFTDGLAGCGGYWAGDYWGYPRWTALSAYFGYELDMAYCLGSGYVPTENTTWGKVKSLYR